nr:hypothetical protein [Agrobacterium vitis]
MAALGAGRPLDSDGFPPGPWTPELLTEAISQIDSNQIGVDLRTVQLWFQEQEKGISTANIRWLARIFGCDDPIATSEWQMELIAAQSRLTTKRRASKKKESSAPLNVRNLPLTEAAQHQTKTPTTSAQDSGASQSRLRFSLAKRSEKLFSRGSPLDLPASVFAAATALGFLSYFMGIHNATYGRADGVTKQVGFLWAPNWTVLFMVFLPLFFAFVSDLVGFWKHQGRLEFATTNTQMEREDRWALSVEASSYTFWAVFVVCVLFAGIFQWIAVCLIPLVEGGGNYAVDWSKLAVVRPEVISVPMAILFTGLAYLYMCVSFYLFFAGLILLHTLTHDLWKIGETSRTWSEKNYEEQVQQASLRVMHGIFRCTVLGILIAICMKAQSSYLASTGNNIVAWLVDDISTAFYESKHIGNGFRYTMPNYYSSLLIALSSCFVFVYGSIRLGGSCRFVLPLWKMTAVIALLFTSYLLIGAFQGFSILMSIGVVLAIYGLIDPAFCRRQASEIGKSQNVS